MGADGVKGDKGIQGDIGVKGDKGIPGNPGDKGDDGNPGDKGDLGTKGDPGVDGKPGFSAAVFSFATKLSGTATSWLGTAPPPPLPPPDGTPLTFSEFLNLEGLSTLTPSGLPSWPGSPALPNGANVIPSAPAGINNNFFGRVMPANGYVTHFAVNFVQSPDRTGIFKIAIANAVNSGTGPTSQLVDEDISMGPDSAQFGSVTIPIVLNTNARFTKGSYIFALSFGKEGGSLPPLGLTSISVYVNFE